MDYRKHFRRDVVIDMYCSPLGHNEADEPSFTQPLMYKAIQRHPSVHEVYAQGSSIAGSSPAPEVEQRCPATTSASFGASSSAPSTWARDPRSSRCRARWSGYVGGRDGAVPDVDTGCARTPCARSREPWRGCPRLPAAPKLVRLLGQRADMARAARPITGPWRGAGLRLAALGRAPLRLWNRTAGAAPSASATRCWST